MRRAGIFVFVKVFVESFIRIQKLLKALIRRATSFDLFGSLDKLRIPKDLVFLAILDYPYGYYLVQLWK